MSETRIVFLSAVSTEFRSYCQILAESFRRLGLDYRVIVQEDLPQAPGDLLETLDVEISKVDLVIHLVGDLAGATPNPASIRKLKDRHPNLLSHEPELAANLAEPPEPSFTQWELYLAYEHRKPRLVYLAKSNAPRSPSFTKPTVGDSQAISQQTHLARLKATGGHYESFANQNDLAMKVITAAVRWKPPKVFISYSHDSEEHSRRVLELSNRLRRQGVESEIDQYDSHPEQGWPRWVEEKIRWADFVLLICTENYYLRLAGEEEPGKERGVKWEGNLIYQHLYHAGVDNKKFLSILFVSNDARHIPIHLLGSTFHRVDTEEGFNDLYRHLTNQPKVARPELGPTLPLKSRSDEFLKKDLVHDEQAERQIPAVLTRDPRKFYSCFISYSHEDEDFAECLHKILQDNGVRCWFAPEDIKGGKKIFHQIEEAIRIHDRLLLILSEASIQSDWVAEELKRARKRELDGHKTVLFPVRICPWNVIRGWKLFDPDEGRDLASEIRSYFVPDFSNWRKQGFNQKAFRQLLEGLKSDETKGIF